MSTYEFSEAKLARIREVFRYDPETGQFIRIDGKGRNRRLKDPTATAKTYKQLNVDGIIYYGHIVAWWLMNNAPVPSGYEIDHKDRDKQNCRWDNLRLVTSSQNKVNRGRRKDCPKGVPGVRPTQNRMPWRAEIRVDHVTYPLGSYATRKEAIRARLDGEIKHVGHIVSDYALALLEEEE